MQRTGFQKIPLPQSWWKNEPDLKDSISFSKAAGQEEKWETQKVNKSVEENYNSLGTNCLKEDLQ